MTPEMFAFYSACITVGISLVIGFIVGGASKNVGVVLGVTFLCSMGIAAVSIGSDAVTGWWDQYIDAPTPDPAPPSYSCSPANTTTGEVLCVPVTFVLGGGS